MENFDEPQTKRRGQQPEPLQKIDEGLDPIMLKLKGIADYLPETLKTKKSEFDEIDFMEVQEIIREYRKKLPPPESELTPDNLIVLHNLRIFLEGSYKLLKMRWDARFEEFSINVRKRGPQKPRQRRPAPKVVVPTEVQAAADPPPSSLDIPNVEQIFEDMKLVADPRSITLEDVPMRPLAPLERFGMGFDEEAVPDGARPMPMGVDGVPVQPPHDPEIDQQAMEIEGIPAPTDLEGSVPPALIEEIPAPIAFIEESIPSVQMPEEAILPRIIIQEPSAGPSPSRVVESTPGAPCLSLERLLDQVDEMPEELRQKRRRRQKILPNKCRKRGTQLTRQQVNKAMSSLDVNLAWLVKKVTMTPRPEPDDDNPCLLPNRNVQKWAKIMPEFSDRCREDESTERYHAYTTHRSHPQRASVQCWDPHAPWSAGPFERRNISPEHWGYPSSVPTSSPRSGCASRGLTRGCASLKRRDG